MLERAPGCIEKGSRSFFGYSRKSCPSHRALHSTFWNHGAAEINVGPWWLAFLQRPSPERFADRQSFIDKAHTNLIPGLGEEGFLDFLYPAKARKLIRNLAIRDVACNKNLSRNQLSAPYRAYSSAATAESDLPDNANQQADELVETLRDTEEFGNMIVAISNMKRQRKFYDDRCLKMLAQAEEALPANRGLIGVEVERFESLQSVGADLLNRYISRIRGLLRRKEKSEWLSHHYRIAVHLCLFLPNQDEQALRLYKQALRKFQDQLVTPIISRHAVENKRWQLGVDAWDAYNKTMQSEDYFWSGLQDMSGKTLVANAIELVDYVKEEKHNADTFLRAYAIKLIENIFAMRHLANFDVDAFDHYRLFLKLRSLVWQPSARQYQLAIGQCLALKFQMEDNNLRLFGENAIRFYMAMRSKDILPDEEMLQNLFKRACQIHNVDTRLIFGDLVNHFGTPSLAIYRHMLQDHLYHRDLRGFYSLLSQVEEKFSFTMNHETAFRVIQMHARLGQVNEAVQFFSSICHRTGAPPNIAHWNAVVTAYVWAEDLDGAYKWITQMEDKGETPDLHTFIPILNYQARRGDADAVKRLIEDLKSRGFHSNGFYTRSLIRVNLQNGELDEARRYLLDSIHEDFEGRKTPLWNMVLSSFARLRGTVEVRHIHAEMQQAGIPEDEMTYAALASAMVSENKLEPALKFLRASRRNKSLRLYAFHMAIIMEGLLKKRQYEQVFILYRWMIKHAIAPDFATDAMLIKAAAMIDKSDLQKPINKNITTQVLTRAEEVLNQVMEASSANRPPRLPVKGLGHWYQGTETLLARYFSSLMYLYGQQRMFGRANQMFSRYIEFVDHQRGKIIKSDNPIPIQILVALMVSNRKVRKHDEVERLWKYTLEKARSLVNKQGTNPQNSSGWVLPARRFIVSAPLIQYMKSLITQKRAHEFEDLFKDLHTMGYGIDSRAWNLYVQQAALSGRHLHAFKTAESELMGEWVKWSRRPVKGVRDRQPNSLQPEKRFPTYKTLVILARSFLIARSQSVDVQTLTQNAPQTVSAVQKMPNLKDKMQQKFLTRLSN